MNILVAGGAGYLGSCVVDELLERGAHVTVMDSLLFCEHYDVRSVEFVRGDVTDVKDMTSSVGRSSTDCIIWLAGIVGDAACAADPARARAVNVESVRWVSETYHGRFIIPSSCSVYGAMDGVATEDSPFNPLSIYAETKIAAEDVLSGRPDTYVFRLGTLHGLSRRMRFDLIVNAMTRRAVVHRKIEVYGGKQHRPLLHVSDAARVFVEAVLGDAPAGTYNLATENLSVSEVADIVSEVTGADVVRTEFRYEDKRDYQVSSSKARMAFSLDEFVDVETSATGMERCLESGRIPNPLHPRFYNSKPPED